MYKLIKSSTTGKYEPMECQAQALIPSVAALQAGDYRFVKSKAFHSVIVEDRPHCILMQKPCNLYLLVNAKCNIRGLLTVSKSRIIDNNAHFALLGRLLAPFDSTFFGLF
jgi:hypothetical protein